MSKSSSTKYYGEKNSKSLWDQICEEFDAERATMENTDLDDAVSVGTDVTQYSARRHTPIVYGRYVHHTPVDANVAEEFDPSVGHPAAIGLSMLSKPEAPPTPPPDEPPDPKTCSPREYLQHYIFPVLLPGIAEMLKEAKREHCFVRKRFRFNGCDFLTEYLYKNNKTKLEKDPSRESSTLDDISFVQSLRSLKPRKPLPLSLQLSEEEAATKIQAFYRGHMVRVNPEVAELSEWQREWKEENHGVRHKIQEFWEKHESMPDDKVVEAST